MAEFFEKVVFGGGCFWCTEAVFGLLKGIKSVTAGYSGGKVGVPTYETVSGGKSGYIEVVEIIYDSVIVSFEELMEVFLASHDPTSQDKQGADIGPQYRSVVFYTSDQQREIALNKIRVLGKDLGQKIVTQVEPLVGFYQAEKYHHEYYANNRSKPYCLVVIDPKVDKVKNAFPNLVKNKHD